MFIDQNTFCKECNQIVAPRVYTTPNGEDDVNYSIECPKCDNIIAED